MIEESLEKKLRKIYELKNLPFITNISVVPTENSKGYFLQDNNSGYYIIVKDLFFEVILELIHTPMEVLEEIYSPFLFKMKNEIIHFKKTYGNDKSKLEQDVMNFLIKHQKFLPQLEFFDDFIFMQNLASPSMASTWKKVTKDNIKKLSHKLFIFLKTYYRETYNSPLALSVDDCDSFLYNEETNSFVIQDLHSFVPSFPLLPYVIIDESDIERRYYQLTPKANPALKTTSVYGWKTRLDWHKNKQEIIHHDFYTMI